MSGVDRERCFFFFFSSRRRHTRFDCDWSSDVCSSDLTEVPPPSAPRLLALRLRGVGRIDAGADLYLGRVRLPRRWCRLGGGGWSLVDEIGRASCRERGVDLGGRRIIKKKNNIDGHMLE